MAHGRAAQIFTATVLSAGLAGTLRVGIADLCKRAGSVSSLRAGLRITPEDAGGWARLGLATQGATQGAESLRALETAVLLNPRDSHSLIDLALRSEKAGDAPKARAYLDQATEIDRGYLPLWTAANFALRHHEVRFAALLHRAFAIAIKGGQDPVPLFDLAWQASGEAEFIATEIVGTETQCQRVYIAYLSEQQRFDALATAAIALAEKHEATDRPMLFETCEALLKHRREAQALDLWNRVATPALNRDHGEVVTNGAMKPPLQIGFDWKFNSSAEHLIAFHGPELGVALDLNGKEPDTLDLLRQPLPLAAGQRYELRWQAHATRPARLLWLVTSGDDDAPFARAEMVLDKAWTEGDTRIAVPTGVHFASLILQLERHSAETRNSNAIWIRGVSMQHAQ